MDPMQVPELSSMIVDHLSLSDLKACTTVCKAWCHTLHPRLWSTFVLDSLWTTPIRHLECSTTNCKSHLHCSGLNALHMNAHLIRRLSLQYMCVQDQPQFVYGILADRCSSLSSLTVDISPTFWRVMEKLLVNNPGIRILVLKTKGHPDWLSITMLMEAMTCCPSLKELTLATELAPSFDGTGDGDSSASMTSSSSLLSPPLEFGLQKLTVCGEYDRRFDNLLARCPRLEQLVIHTTNTEATYALCERLFPSASPLSLPSPPSLCSYPCSYPFPTPWSSSPSSLGSPLSSSDSSSGSLSPPLCFSDSSSGSLSSSSTSSASFSHLSKLVLGSGRFQHRVLRSLAASRMQALPALRSLSLNYPSESALRAITDDPYNIQHLEHLDIRLGIDPHDGLARLLMHCQALKSLAITVHGSPCIDIACILPRMSTAEKRAAGSLMTAIPRPKTVASTTSVMATTWACLQLDTLQLSVGLICQHRMKHDLLEQWQKVTSSFSFSRDRQDTASSHDSVDQDVASYCFEYDDRDHDHAVENTDNHYEDDGEDGLQMIGLSTVTHRGCTCLKCVKTETNLMRQLGLLTRLRRLQIVQSSSLMSSSSSSSSLQMVYLGQRDLSWRLDHGLGHLAGLNQLEVLDLGPYTVFLGGVEELRWMKRHWTALRRLVCAKVYYEVSWAWLCVQWPELQVVEMANL